jgi:hypothetical protein
MAGSPIPPGDCLSFYISKKPGIKNQLSKMAR